MYIYKNMNELNNTNFKKFLKLSKYLIKVNVDFFFPDQKNIVPCQYLCLLSASVHTSASAAWRLNSVHMWLWVVGALNGLNTGGITVEVGLAMYCRNEALSNLCKKYETYIKFLWKSMLFLVHFPLYFVLISYEYQLFV